MLPLLQGLHLIAAKRGDGLRPEFLRMEAEETLSLVFPHVQTQPAALLGDGTTPTQGISVLQSVEPLTPQPPRRLRMHAGWQYQIAKSR